jgi:hypothetical protein
LQSRQSQHPVILSKYSSLPLGLGVEAKPIRGIRAIRGHSAPGGGIKAAALRFRYSGQRLCSLFAPVQILRRPVLKSTLRLFLIS